MKTGDRVTHKIEGPGTVLHRDRWGDFAIAWDNGSTGTCQASDPNVSIIVEKVEKPSAVVK